jgi:hypothetical protein
MSQPAPERPVITLLLSTFNGERFLLEQLNSFLAQTYTDWVLYWRDDGSSDGTLGIMRDFTTRVGAERCVESPSSGRHLGASPSFLALLAESASAQAIAFADQDDVWLPEKLHRAAEHLAAAGSQPALYCARQLLVDAALRGAKRSVIHIPPAFPASLTQNIANGNTLVMNAAAAALVSAMGRPEGSVHDWWSYIVVCASGGSILFDEQPQVLYRLHHGNLIGSARPLAARALAAIQRGSIIFMTVMRRHVDTLAAQAHRLTPQARQDLQLIQHALQSGFMPRLAALLCPRFRRRTVLENFLFAYWFLTSRPEASARRVGAQAEAALPFGTKVRLSPLKSNR